MKNIEKIRETNAKFSENFKSRVGLWEKYGIKYGQAIMGVRGAEPPPLDGRKISKKSIEIGNVKLKTI